MQPFYPCVVVATPIAREEETTDLYYVPDTVYVLFTSYQIVKTRRLSLAYLLIWRKLRLVHLCRSVE